MSVKTRRGQGHAATLPPSSMHFPKIDLQSILASPQPTPIPIYHDVLEDSMRQFMRGVSDYIERAMDEIATRKTKRAAELQRLAERKTQIENETRECNVRELKLAEDMEREELERKDAESSLTNLKRQYAIIEDKCTSIDVEIEQYRADVNALRQEKRRDKDKLGKYASLTSPELKSCEEHLGMVIEGVDKDKLLISFSHIDRSDPSRQFSLVLDVSARTYKVPISTPPLPTLPFLLDELNETRDIYSFLRRVRNCFADMTKTRT